MGSVQVVVRGAEDWSVEPVEVERGPGEVLVELVSAGLCGGDMSMLSGANAVGGYPVTLGHEGVGRVIETTPDGPAVGSHVVIFPTYGCGTCAACTDGRVNHCASMRVFGLSDPRGTFADVQAVPAEACIPIPADVVAKYGSLVEPLAVGCHILGRCGPTEGARILIFGAGMMGLTIAAVTRARGAASVDFIDRFEQRRPSIEAMGGGRLSTATGDELRRWALDEVGPVDLVFDTVMRDETVALGVEILRPGGTLMTVASAKPQHPVTVPYSHVYAKELSLIATRNYVPQDFIDAVAMLERDEVDLRPTVTATYTLDRFDDAIAALRATPQDHIKVLLRRSAG